MTIFYILIFVAMLAVSAVLMMGIFAMVKGGDFNRKYGNKLMCARVGLQGLTLALLGLAFLAS